MPWGHEHDWPVERESLHRIALVLEDIAVSLRYLRPHALEVNGMSLPSGPVAPGTSDTATYTAVDADGNTVAGPITFASSDDTQLTVSGDGSTSGVSVVSWTYLGGSPVLSATFTNPDGSVVDSGSNDPYTFVAQAVDLAVAVNGV